MFALGQEADIEIRGKPGISVEEVDVVVMRNALPILVGTLFAFYVIYRLLK